MRSITRRLPRLSPMERLLTTVRPPMDRRAGSRATNVAFEVTAYLELKAGINRCGVKSTDGFQLTAGSALDRASQGVLIGVFDAARGDQNPTEGPFLVYQDGLYAFRLLYHKRGDPNVSLEWYSR